MSAQFEPVPEPTTSPCPQCSSPVPAAADRCPACGYTLAGVGGRPGPYGHLWGVGAGVMLALAYAIALVIVLLGR